MEEGALSFRMTWANGLECPPSHGYSPPVSPEKVYCAAAGVRGMSRL